MSALAALVLVGHYSLLVLLCLFGMHRLIIAGRALMLTQRGPLQPVPDAFRSLPPVTVQLPVYNEKQVIGRLIDAAAQLDYPAHALSIQVLDDSTDETAPLAAERVAYWQSRGVRIAHIRRRSRAGFKAGALAHGLCLTDAPFVAVFDADFVPDPGLLKALVVPMADPAIGMVQARWDHLNRRSSLLTRVQAIMLDAHFAIEQQVRHATGRYFNFNGTAGLWRVAAIRHAGGWHGDTITEDLDLSYRAQLAGWQFRYLNDVTCLSELPPTLSAFKSQQHRWSKGGIQVMRKLLGRVWAAPTPLGHKLEAAAHLAGNLAHLAMLIDTLVFLIPSLLLRQGIGAAGLAVDALLLVFASLSHMIFYLVGQKMLGRPVISALRYVPALMATAIALAVNNGRAVAEALLGHVSGFVRTPKSGETDQTMAWRRRPRRTRQFRRLAGWPELAAGLTYTLCLLWCASNGLWLAVPFMSLFVVGFLSAATVSLAERA
ncbi:MAG: glycosyltransferase [Rhodothalassiaceae bacterium]